MFWRGSLTWYMHRFITLTCFSFFPLGGVPPILDPGQADQLLPLPGYLCDSLQPPGIPWQTMVSRHGKYVCLKMTSTGLEKWPNTPHSHWLIPFYNIYQYCSAYYIPLASFNSWLLFLFLSVAYVVTSLILSNKPMRPGSHLFIFLQNTLFCTQRKSYWTCIENAGLNQKIPHSWRIPTLKSSLRNTRRHLLRYSCPSGQNMPLIYSILFWVTSIQEKKVKSICLLYSGTLYWA